jgi:hypothetical protein
VGARKRAPGGGRKPLNPDKAKSAKVMVRLKPDLQRALESLAKRHNRDLSKEIRDALYYWLLRSGKPALHVGSLTSLIEVLVNRIEEWTKKRWIDDPLTGVAVREQLDRLIRHLAPKPNKPVTVPRALSHIVDGIIALTEMVQRTSHKELPGLFIHVEASGSGPIVAEEGLVLARIMEDLGRGLERNRAARRHK